MSILAGKHFIKFYLVGIILGVMGSSHLVSAQVEDPTLLTQAIAERTRLTGKIFAVPLIENSKTRPVLATLISKTVYYADYHPDTNSDGICRGQNIYSLSIDTENKSPAELIRSRDSTIVDNLPCILNLFSDGSHLIIRYQDQEDKTISISLLQLTDEGPLLVSPFHAQKLKDGSQDPKGQLLFPLVSAFWAEELLRQTKRSLDVNESNPKSAIPWHDAISYLYTFGSDKRYCEIVETTKKGGPIHLAAFLISLIEPKSSSTFLEFQLPHGVTLSSAKSALSWDDNGGIYLLLPSTSPNGMGKVLALDSVSKTSTLYGIDLPYTDDFNWTSLDRTGTNGWAIKDPRFPAGTEYGLLLMENTTSAREFNNISYISRFENKVYRIQIPPYQEDWGGLFYTHGGILVSHPRSQRIIWYGAKNPFNERCFRTHNADFSSMSDTEYQALTGG